MMAQGFKPVGWVAGVAAAALGCYMLSLQVASERAELASLERRIVAAKQDIRSLQTELGTRGRLSQLEHWNAEVLALSAPASNQFLDNEVMLARFETREKTIEERAPLRLASAETVAVPDQPVATAQPRLIQAAANVGAAVPQPVLRKASYTPSPASPAEVVAPKAAVKKMPVEKAAAEKASAQPKKKAETVAAAKPQKKSAPVKSAGLLGDDVLGDLSAAAKSETRKGSGATR
ncbi:hypothetical protein [Allosphingosinicella vermicomposti]|uniref:hypothetical protein n=1 Tax=Allosphingosinicella vermicomposti TaxID=614671 RepID=UPI00131A607F|nr:hypothetical protein [Allosphingosinicella vermicomposti]